MNKSKSKFQNLSHDELIAKIEMYRRQLGGEQNAFRSIKRECKKYKDLYHKTLRQLHSMAYQAPKYHLNDGEISIHSNDCEWYVFINEDVDIPHTISVHPINITGISDTVIMYEKQAYDEWIYNDQMD